jgi:hypothetical protein
MNFINNFLNEVISNASSKIYSYIIAWQYDSLFSFIFWYVSHETSWLHDYETHNQDWNLIPESWKRSDKNVTLVISRTQECKNHSHIQAENLEWYYSITT